MPACGKEEFLKIARDKGFSVVRMGDIVREEASKVGIILTDRAVGSFADEERKKYGYGVWAERTVPRISGELNLIDGIRGLAEVEVFRSSFPGELCVVAIHSSPATRLRRILTRKREDDPANESEFSARDRRELRWGLGEVISLADYIIVNEGRLEAFRENAKDILDKILSGGKF